MEKVEMSIMGIEMRVKMVTIMRIKMVVMGKLRIVLLHVEEDVGDERVDC